jgi:chromosome segregation ATPase
LFVFLCFQLNQMKMEIHSVSSKAKKDEYNAKIKTYNTRVAAAKKALLFSGSSGAAAAGGPNADVRARQQTAEEKQAASLEVLKKARAQLAETEQVGVSTVEALSSQEEQIRKSRQNMEEVNSNLNHSNKLLNKMSQWWRG